MGRGPGQSQRFVVPAFAAQLKAIAEKEAPNRISVGNLSSIRSFMDVRDVVHAYRLIIERGRAGEAYNMGSTLRLPIQAVLDSLCEIAGVAPDITVDPDRYRPSDQSPVLDISKLKADTCWCPEIPIDQTLREIYAAV